jgi:hypothetical protein
MLHHRKELKVGDRVIFSGSSIDAGGTIVQVLQEDYVRVRWNSSRVATTHRRHALEYAGSH